MFQIRGLIAFCGLLAQTTAMLDGQPVTRAMLDGQPTPTATPDGQPKPIVMLDGQPVTIAMLDDQTMPTEEVPPFVLIPGGPLSSTDLSRHLTSALSNGLLSAGLPDALKNLPLQEVLKNVEGSSDELNGVLLGKVTSLTSHLKIIDVMITNPELLELTLEQNSDGHRLYINIPLGMVLNVNVVKLDLHLNITGEISAVKDEQGKVHLVLGNCTNFLGDLEISLLKGRLPHSVDKLLGKLTGLLSKAIPVLVQRQVCPLVNKVLGNLDVALVYNIANKLIPGMQFSFKF